MRRAITQREARAFRRYEAEMLRAYDALLAVTEEDRQLLLALFDEPERSRQASKLTVVPICVDPERVRPVAKMLNDECGVMNADYSAIPHSSLRIHRSALQPYCTSAPCSGLPM